MFSDCILKDDIPIMFISLFCDTTWKVDCLNLYCKFETLRWIKNSFSITITTVSIPIFLRRRVNVSPPISNVLTVTGEIDVSCTLQILPVMFRGLIIPNDTVQYYILQFRVVWFNAISNHILQCCFIWYNTKGVLFSSFRATVLNSIKK